jgi:hypothetical protein
MTPQDRAALARRVEEVAVADAMTRLLEALGADRPHQIELEAVCRLTGLSLADSRELAEHEARYRYAPPAPR